MDERYRLKVDFKSKRKGFFMAAKETHKFIIFFKKYLVFKNEEKAINFYHENTFELEEHNKYMGISLSFNKNIVKVEFKKESILL